MTSTIDQIELDYARFNARKTFSTLLPSEFEHRVFGELVATRDPTRADPYYNRILGLTTGSADLLDDAVAWIANGTSARQTVRIDVDAASDANGLLADRGYERIDELVWLGCETRAAHGVSEQPSRLLTRADWPALRELLHGHGLIAEDIWQARRSHLCTTTFRWLGIFDNDFLVSAASTWITADAVVLGSAYTLPRWRRRGYQLCLLEQRLNEAEHRAFVDVAPDSTSYRNCIRAGFVENERRVIWGRQNAPE